MAHTRGTRLKQVLRSPDGRGADWAYSVPKERHDEQVAPVLGDKLIQTTGDCSGSDIMLIGSLPESNDVNIGAVAGSFGNVTNSYKFYWALAILDAVHEQHQRTVSVDWLLSRMVARVWHPVHYFRLQFGKSDKLTRCADLVKGETSLTSDSSVADVTAACAGIPRSSPAGRQRDELGRYVPFRFIRPFFAAETKGLQEHEVNPRLRVLAEQSFRAARPPLYRFLNAEIEFSEAWFVYLLEHVEVLRGFVNWHLLRYLQARNPNVGNISGKLAPPEARDLTDAKRFWRAAIKDSAAGRCIYSGLGLPATGFSVDHFLPWSFVAHDAMWNLCPTLPEVNSAKGDWLPDLGRYLRPFVSVQYKALQHVGPGCAESLLEDYALLFATGSRNELLAVSEQDFGSRLENALRPQFQIAANCGFPGEWIYAMKN